MLMTCWNYCGELAMGVRMNLDVLSTFPKFANANCVNVDDPDVFFPDSNLQLQRDLPMLREICGSCLHQAECLTYALENEINDGIWAGTTPAQRQGMRKQRQKEDTRSTRHREIRYWLSVGFTKDEVAHKLGIKRASLDRVLDRAAKKGLQ